MSEKNSIVCFGELVVDCFGSIQDGFVPKFGGAPGNTAVGLAKLGQKNIRFSGKVGADFFGDFLERTMQSFRVDTHDLFRDTEHKTTLAFVSLGEKGQRDFSFYAGAHEHMTPQESARIDVSHACILQFGSLTQSNAEAKEATANLLRAARAEGTYISYDPNVRAPLWPNLDVLKQAILETLPMVDMVKVNEEELEFLTGTKDPKAGAAQLWQDSLQLLLITLGEQGAYWKTATGEGRVQTLTVQPVDTTGAGDAFNAGMLFQLFARISDGRLQMNETELQKAVQFANTVAALSTLKKGAIEALPTLEEVEQALAETRTV